MMKLFTTSVQAVSDHQESRMHISYTVSIDAEDAVFLEEISKSSGINRSKVVQKIIKLVLDDEELIKKLFPLKYVPAAATNSE